MRKEVPPIRFDKEFLNKLIKEENSCVEIQEQNYHIELQPYHLTNINESIKDILNKQIAKYDRELGGILLGYQNIKLLSDVGAVLYDSFFIHADFSAPFYLFKPAVGSVLHGVVNKKSQDHVGCLVHNTFNVSLPQPADDDDWMGLKAQIGHEISFRVTFVNLEARLPYIRAEFVSIISECDSGFDTSEENQNAKLKPKKLKFDSEQEQDADEEKAKKELKKKKRKHSHAADEENKIEELQIKMNKKSKKSTEYEETINEVSSKKKKSKHKHQQVEEGGEDQVENELVETSCENTSSKKKKKHKNKRSLEELTNEVLQKTLLSFNETTKNEKKKRKHKKTSDGDEISSGLLPDLNLNKLFEETPKKLVVDDNFVMADNEDKTHKKRRSSVAVPDNPESKIDLLADSDLDRICKDVENSSKKHKSIKKRQRSTSSDEFEAPKKKSKKR